VNKVNVQEPMDTQQGRTLLAWHFARNDSRQDYGACILIEPGGTERIDERDGLVLCRWGLHASVRAIDALGYGKGLNVRRVELRGHIVEGDDKACATERRELWRIDGRRPLLEWAIWAAQQYVDALGNGCAGIQAQSRRLLTTIAEFVDGRCDEAAVLGTLTQTPSSSSVVVQLARVAADGTSPAILNAAFGAAFGLCDATNHVAPSRETVAACNAELERRLLALAPEAAR
jgi:hypothetical protein